MAVLGATYNQQLGTNDWNYAYQVWKNVNFENNTIKITQEELDAFNERWDKEFKSWEIKYKEEDSVEYDLEDEEDFDITFLEEDLRTDNRKTKSQTAVNTVTTGLQAASIVGSAISTVNSINLGIQAAQSAGLAAFASSQGGILMVNSSIVTAEAASATANSLSAASAAAGTLGKALCFVGCSITLATGVLYQATRPNRDAHQALMELQNLMLAGNADIQVQQLLMEQTQEQISDTATTTETEFAEAEVKQETEKSELERKQEELAVKTELLLMATIIQESIRTRIESGEKLSESDKAQFKAASATIQSLTGEIQVLQDEMATLQGNLIAEQTEFEETKDEAKSEMNSLEATYSDRVDRFTELQQIADLAGSFDEITANLCKSQIAMQALNVATGTISMLQALGFGFIGFPFSAMAMAGIGLSTSGMVEQASFLNDIKGEIKTREQVQTNLANSFNFFTGAVNQYDTDKGLVDSLDFEEIKNTPETEIVPKDTGDATLPTEPTPAVDDANNAGNPFITAENSSAENVDPKKNPFAV